MFDPAQKSPHPLSAHLARKGYWPARAAECLAEGKYARAVEICLANMDDNLRLASGRLIYARALFHADQIDSAIEQFYQVLSLDPENLVALKYLGDAKFARGDEIAALANYRRVLEIDPLCRGLHLPLAARPSAITRTITLPRSPESTAGRPEPLRKIPIVTETFGDLYLAQGHPRLAAWVFRELSSKSENPRLREKLKQAEKRINVRKQ